MKLPRLWHSPNQNLGKEIISRVKAHQGQVLESVQKISRSRMDRRDDEQSLTRLMLSDPDLEGDPLKLLRTSEAFWKVFNLLNSFQNLAFKGSDIATEYLRQPQQRAHPNHSFHP